MKKVMFNSLLFLMMLLTSCSKSAEVASVKNRAEQILEYINDPTTDHVIVIAHRGDWRNYPENSIPAIESVIRMGADVMELDLMLTVDSVLVLCHDQTIDRTTTGKGLISELTYEYINSCFLRAGHNHPTEYKMPTLREALEVCKDHIVVNVDKGFQYYDMVIEISEELGVTEQILIKGKKPMDQVSNQMKKHEAQMMYMPIIDINKPNGQMLFKEYSDSGIVPIAYEVCWDEDTPEFRNCLDNIKSQASKIWINTLWPSLCGGKEGEMYDDFAFDNGAEHYNKALSLGASMIQTDRPELLIEYLRSIGRHD